MNWEDVDRIAAGVGGGLAIAVALWTTLRVFRMRSLTFSIDRERTMLLERQLSIQETHERLTREVADRTTADRKTLAEIIEEIKDKFAKVTSVSFHFVDENEIKNFRDYQATSALI